MPLLITLMALGTVVLNVALVVGVLALFNRSSRARLLTPIRRYALMGIFMLSTLAVLGTLWMQYGDNLQPCLLCWWQRVFMYPIPIITLIAIIKNTDFSQIADYVLTFSVFGAAFALYQHLLQVLPAGALIPCDSSGDCSVRSVFEFGYITIPWMALSLFAIFIFVALVVRKRS